MKHQNCEQGHNTRLHANLSLIKRKKFATASSRFDSIAGTKGKWLLDISLLLHFPSEVVLFVLPPGQAPRDLETVPWFAVEVRGALSKLYGRRGFR